MNSITRKLRGLAVAALTGAALLSQVHASPVVYVDPNSQSVAQLGVTTADIWVSGLTQAIGGFSLTLSWDGTLVTGGPFTVDPAGAMGPLPLDLSPGLAGSTLVLDFLADGMLTEPQLAASEGASFKLATITFTAGATDGLSFLSLTKVGLSNFAGTAVLGDVTTRDGSICVGGNCNVPEPTTALLVATALGALVIRRRVTA